MRDTYLLEVIRALNAEELRDFELFLSSPFFSKGSSSIELLNFFKIIVLEAPDFNGENLEKSRVYSKVFPGKEVVEGKLEKLMADLNKLLRKYILIRPILISDEEVKFQIEWAKWLRQHGLDARFQQVLAKIKANKEIQKVESLYSFRKLFEIAEEEHEWALSNNKVKGDLAIPQFMEQFDLFYQCLRTELSNRFLLQKKVGQIVSSLDNSIENTFVFTPSVMERSVLAQAIQAINTLFRQETPTPGSFNALLDLLVKSESILAEQTKKELYTYLRSYCSILIDNGHLEYVATLHNIQRVNLEAGHLFEDGKIGPNTYSNLVQIAIRAKQIDWALEFTEKYKDLIIGQEDAPFFYRLNLASCLFACKKFNEALDSLPEVSPAPYYHLIARRLELKIYYEQNSDLLPYKIDSFRKYVERTAPKSVSSQNNDMNLSFANMLSQISQSPKKDRKRAERLEERIKNKKLIGERAWLLEKARELA